MELDRLQVAELLFVVGLAGALMACRASAPPAANSATRTTTQSSGYQAPPDLVSVGGQDGWIDVSGVATPGAAVRLATPTGAASFATAEAGGKWRMRIPSSAEPRLFGLSMSAGGRVVQAIGYLFIAPDGQTARLRAGGGSEVIEQSAGGVRALVVDYDTQRAATLSGKAPPGVMLSLRVDGVERGQATAGPDGRFVMPLNQPLSAGSHHFDLVGADKEVETQAAIGAPVRLTNAPFFATRSGAGWRVDWLTPGGGEQTTLILGAADRAL
jgi:hypothetical protein